MWLFHVKMVLYYMKMVLFYMKMGALLYEDGALLYEDCILLYEEGSYGVSYFLFVYMCVQLLGGCQSSNCFGALH